MAGAKTPSTAPVAATNSRELQDSHPATGPRLG
jgi:hypothetical protein